MKTRIHAIIPGLLAFAFLASSSPGFGAVLLSGLGGTYTQTFDTLPTASGFSTWTDNSTLPNWYMRRQASNTVVSGNFLTQQNISNGIVPTNWGLTDSSDRSLGAQVSNAGSAPVALGVLFYNDSLDPFSIGSISYVGEQWRQSSAAPVVSFSYQISSTAITDPNSSSQTPAGFTSIAALGFTGPQTGTNGFLNGNLAANQVAVSSSNLGIPELQAGEYLFLRWYFAPNTSADIIGASIDNLTVTVVPEPGTSALALLALGGAWFSSRRRPVRG